MPSSADAWHVGGNAILLLHNAAYAASRGIVVLAHHYVQIREGGGQPSPQVPLGGASLFCEDLLLLDDRAGPRPRQHYPHTHTHTHTHTHSGVTCAPPTPPPPLGWAGGQCACQVLNPERVPADLGRPAGPTYLLPMS